MKVKYKSTAQAEKESGARIRQRKYHSIECQAHSHKGKHMMAAAVTQQPLARSSCRSGGGQAARVSREASDAGDAKKISCTVIESRSHADSHTERQNMMLMHFAVTERRSRERGTYFVSLFTLFLRLPFFSLSCAVQYSSKFVPLSQLVVRGFGSAFCGFRFPGRGMNCNEDQCSPSCDV